MKSWRLKKNKSDQLGQFPPRVSLVQWILVTIPVVIAAAAFDITSYKVLALVTLLLGVMSLSLVIVVAKEALHTRLIGKLCLAGGTFIFYWSEALVAAIQDDAFAIPDGFPIHAAQFDQELITQALFYIAVFQLFLFIGYSVRPHLKRTVGVFTSRVDSLSFDRWLLAVLLVVCSLTPLLFYYEFEMSKIIAVLLASRTSVDFEAPEPGLSQHLALFGIYGAALFFVYAFQTTTWRRFWWLFLGAMTGLPFLTGGTRHIWLFISLPSFLILLRGFKGNLDRYRVLGLTAAGFVVLAVAQMQFVYRQVGWTEVGNVRTQELTQLNTTGQFTALLYAEYLVPNEHSYFMELVEPYFLIHWIPRQMWPDKPAMESWAYYNESYVQGASFNVTPSVIGQFHINWGLPGVIFIGAWLGFLTFMVDRVVMLLISDRQRAMFVSAGMFYAFIISSFRFYSPIYFSYFLFGFLAMLLLTRRRALSKATAELRPRLTTGPNVAPEGFPTLLGFRR